MNLYLNMFNILTFLKFKYIIIKYFNVLNLIKEIIKTDPTKFLRMEKHFVSDYKTGINKKKLTINFINVSEPYQIHILRSSGSRSVLGIRIPIRIQIPGT